MLILRDLFFASALPSGNDAANTLAEFVGDILLKERQDNYSYRSGAGKVP
jgi:D-alanyl-D-alanine carboxypeptidase